MSKLKWIVLLAIPIWLVFSAGPLLAVEYDLYTVRSGDNLWKLVGPNYPRVIEINELDPCGTIYPGQKLKIPKGYLGKSPFKEKAGDCIAKKPVKRLVKILKPIEPCESVRFTVSRDRVKLEIDLTKVEDSSSLVGQIAYLHAQSLNHKPDGHDNDVIATARIDSDKKLTFFFENQADPNTKDEKDGFRDRMWITAESWIVPPCSEYLYPDSNGNLALEFTITSSGVYPVPENWPRDIPRKYGLVKDVYPAGVRETQVE